MQHYRVFIDQVSVQFVLQTIIMNLSKLLINMSKTY